jgi:hypothetical protein
MRPAGPLMAAVAMCGMAAPASAQAFTPDSTVSYTLSWSEVDADYHAVADPDGVLERGERALLALSVAFTNQNTVGHFSPPVGTFTSGTIRAFLGGVIDLIGASPTGSAAGLWTTDPNLGFGVDPSWDLLGPPGYGAPIADGARLVGIEFGQFPGSPNGLNPQNPILRMWRGTWTPESYQARLVSFHVGDSAVGMGYPASQVGLRTGPSTLAGVFCASNFGSVGIPVIPSPSGAWLLAAGLAWRRRARSRYHGDVPCSESWRSSACSCSRARRRARSASLTGFAATA